MGFRYVLAMNLKGSIADSLNLQSLDINIRNACAMAGFGIEGPRSSKHSIDGFSFLPPRQLLSVALNVAGTDTLSVAQTRSLDAAIVGCVKNMARVGWSVQGIVGGLPGQGNGSYSVSMLPTADIGEVQRDVGRGGGIPQVTITAPVSQTTIQETTDPSVVPGTRTPSSAKNLSEQASDWASQNKPIVYGVLGVIGLTAVAVIVVKVKS
jgi:hypothetical protein